MFFCIICVIFWATVTSNGSPYMRDRFPVCLSVCLSVTLVYCGQTVGWIQICHMVRRYRPWPRRYCVRRGHAAPHGKEPRGVATVYQYIPSQNQSLKIILSLTAVDDVRLLVYMTVWSYNYSLLPVSADLHLSQSADAPMQEPVMRGFDSFEFMAPNKFLAYTSLAGPTSAHVYCAKRSPISVTAEIVFKIDRILDLDDTHVVYI